MHFTGLALTVICTFSSVFVAARPASGPKVIHSLTTVDQLNSWLSSTDANITYIGQPPSDSALLSSRQFAQTTVVYCDTVTVDVCGGACTVYTGGPTCLDASNTQCLMATNNVGFCDQGGCGGSCNQFSTCGTQLGGGFCDTPGTASINVGA